MGLKPTGKYSTNSLWWEHEKLHRTILMDFQKRHQLFNEKRNNLEKEFYKESINTASNDFINLTISAFEKSKQLEHSVLKEIINLPIDKKSKSSYRRYWKTQNIKAGIEV